MYSEAVQVVYAFGWTIKAANTLPLPTIRQIGNGDTDHFREAPKGQSALGQSLLFANARPDPDFR